VDYKGAIAMGALFGCIVVVMMWAAVHFGSGEGIVTLGENGNGVLLCGESIVLNATEDVSHEELRAMFTEALYQDKAICDNLRK
jgi:hypothetical protein